MNCREADPLLISYLRGEVSYDLKHDLEFHLDQCPQCRTRLRYAQQEWEALRFSGDVPALSEDFAENVMALIQNEKSTKSIPSSVKWLSGLRRGSLAGAGLAAAVLILWLAWPGAVTQNPVPPSVSDSISQEEMAKSSDRIAGTDSAGTAAQNYSAAAEDEAITSNQNPEATAVLDNTVAQKEFDQKESDQGESISPKVARDPAASFKVMMVPDQISELVWQPGYLPSGYYLIQSEHDASGTASFYFQNDSGGYISLVIRPESNTVGTGAQDDEIIEVPSAASTSLESVPAQLTWTVEKDGSIYVIQLTGTPSPDEMNQIAHSIIQ